MKLIDKIGDIGGLYSLRGGIYAAGWCYSSLAKAALRSRAGICITSETSHGDYTPPWRLYTDIKYLVF